MKRICILTALVLTFVLVLTSTATTVAQPIETTSNYQSNYTPQQLLSGYLNYAPRRTAGTDEMRFARQFIGETLSDIGFPTDDYFKLLPTHTYHTFDDFGFEFEDQSGRLVYGYNKYAFLIVNPLYPTILVSAHMDSIGQGATDNASGVVASLMIADILFRNQDQLTCNVIFAYFDAEELGCYGSEYYAYQLNSTPDSIQIDAVINLDSVAGGDNLYVYCEDVATQMQDYLLNSCPQFQAKPIGADLHYGISYWTYGYYQQALASDHTEFRVYGIPTAIVYSGNYDWRAMGYVQSLDKNHCVMNTTMDTLEHFNSLPNGYNQINTVANAVAGALLSNQFVGICQNVAKFELVDLELTYGVLAPSVVAQAIILVVGLISIAYYQKLKKEAILNPSEVANKSIFDEVDYHDIFQI